MRHIRPLDRRLTTQGGFSLIELMVVIVILGGLIAIVGPNLFGNLERANRQQAHTQMHSLRTAVDSYRLAHRGSLPTELALLTRADPSTGEPWIERIPRDPWGGEYRLLPGDQGRFRIQSAGRDRHLDTPDDLFNPDDVE